ncbi:MAG: hypothetical protein WC517_04935, partial [Patescibacteria group bacterium]
MTMKNPSIKEMIQRARKRSVLSMILTALILVTAGCADIPDISGQDSKAPQDSAVSIQSNSPSITEGVPEIKMQYRIFAPDHQLLLIPAAIPVYYQGLKNGATLFYSLSEDRARWEPATCKATKIASITGLEFPGAEETTIDVYRVDIGSWTGYYKYKA